MTSAFRVAARVDSNGTGANGSFDGVIDEVRLWSQPGAASEIAATMSTTVPPSSPLAYWRFDEGSGATTADESPPWHARQLADVGRVHGVLSEG